MNFYASVKEEQQKIIKPHQQSVDHLESTSTMMRKSASTGGIRTVKIVRKSLSPATHRQEKDSSKQKNYIKMTGK